MLTEQQGRQVGPAQAFEVHRQERRVSEHVPRAQAGIELQAVQDAWAVVQQEDVVGEQVPVAVPTATGCLACREQRVPTVQVLLGEPLQVTHLGQRHVPGAVCAQLRGVRPPQPEHGVRADGDRLDALVEVRQQPRELVHLDAQVVATRRHERQPAVVGHASHDHDGLVQALDTGERRDAEVDVGGEPAVERHLRLGDVLAGLAGGQVDELGPDRLLGLQDPVADHHEPGQVRLGRAERRRGLSDGHPLREGRARGPPPR